MTIRIGITGAKGRMGEALIAAIGAETRARLVAAIERADHPDIGEPLATAMDVRLAADIVALCAASDVVIDFSSPTALPANLAATQAARTALVIGTTGLTAADHALIDDAAKQIPLLQAANMSLGIAILGALVRQAVTTLGPDWDIEIVEMHHRHKVDAPSGTALHLGKIAATARGVTLEQVRTLHDGNELVARSRGDIGFASLRGGSVAGDHLVVLASDGERLELGHRAEDRSIFARGAVKAALWLTGQAPGRYTIEDMLGLG